MPNLTIAQIQAGLAAIIAAVDPTVPVLTDTRFMASNAELLRLVRSQNTDFKPQGWIITWGELPQHVDEGTCDVQTTYTFQVYLLYPYLNDSPNGETSEDIFEGLLFAASEALNRSRYLGLGSRVYHQGLRTTAPIGVTDWGEPASQPISHLASLQLNVDVLNSY
jgi:hypothetical protein